MTDEYNKQQIKELKQELEKVDQEIEYNKQLLIKGLQEIPIELFNYNTICDNLNTLLDTKHCIIIAINAHRY